MEINGSLPWTSGSRQNELENFQKFFGAEKLIYVVYSLKNCETFINKAAVSPSRNNQLSTITGALNFKFSADVLCNPAPNGQWKNILHVTSGASDQQFGARAFCMIAHINEDIIEFSVHDPNHWTWRQQYSVYCNSGEWNTYSLEVRQVDGSSLLRSVVSVDGNQIGEFTYEASLSINDHELNVFAGSDFWASASDYSVRNFFYQTF